MCYHKKNNCQTCKCQIVKDHQSVFYNPFSLTSNMNFPNEKGWNYSNKNHPCFLWFFQMSLTGKFSRGVVSLSLPWRFPATPRRIDGAGWPPPRLPLATSWAGSRTRSRGWRRTETKSMTFLGQPPSDLWLTMMRMKKTATALILGTVRDLGKPRKSVRSFVVVLVVVVASEPVFERAAEKLQTRNRRTLFSFVCNTR